MSWGVSLWDQFPTLGAHTQKGIDFCEKFVVFVKEWCAMENEYASKIKRLVKSYQPKKKDDPEGELSFTWMQGFQGVLREMHDIANQHEIVSEELNQQVQHVLVNLAKELKESRRKALQEQAKQEALLLQQLQLLDKAKKQYEKSFKDGEKSVENYKRIDADQSFPRIDVEKAKNAMHQRLQQCEVCKTSYAAELQKTNDAQLNYYSTTLPGIIQQLQTAEEQRIEQTRRLIHTVADVESRVMPILQRCIEGIRQSADAVDPRQDTQHVVSKLETGYKPPGDLVFDDLGTPGVPDSGSTAPGIKDSGSATKAARSKSMRSSSISGSGRKSQRGLLPGLFSGGKVEEPKEDYSHLPPNQQRKKLLAKIDTLSQAIAKDTAERDGMQKMREVYTQNPKLGDPATIDKQLQENAQKLDKLMLERKKYEYFLMEAERQTADVNGASPHDARRPSSLTNNNNGANHDHDVTRRYSKPSITSEDSFEDDERGGTIGGGDSTTDGTPVLGTCIARYPFTASSDGSISMANGEELLVVESDQGDGWTLVRRRGPGAEEGFVPTSYIDCYLHR